MGTTLWIVTTVLSVHLVHTYILLTANLEDVQAIAKQIATSPVAGQINKVLRRATDMFNRQVERSRIRKRAEEDEGSAGQDALQSRGSEDSDEEQDTDNRIGGRRADDELVTLGKNASYYLKSIKQIFENV